MISRLLGSLIAMGGLFFGTIGMAEALPTTISHISVPIPVSKSAPELDPSALGGGIMILAGGLLLLNERNRANR